MSDYTPTLGDVKVALAMGFSLPNGQHPADALDDYIEGVTAAIRADERERVESAIKSRQTAVADLIDLSDGDGADEAAQRVVAFLLSTLRSAATRREGGE